MDRTVYFTTSVPAAIAMVVLAVVVIFGAVVAARRSRDRAAAQAHAEATDAAATARARLLTRLDHELKNPLTALQTAAASTQQLVTAEHDERPDVEAAIAAIGTSSRRIARLLADLRKLTDIETRDIDRRPVDVAALIDVVVDDAGTAPGADERTITTSVPRAPWPIPKVLGDEDLLHTAVLNLLTNAIKYSTPGDTIEVRASDVNGAWVAVDVADTGRGIPDDEHEGVWDELSRGADVRAIPGSGMGLALVRAIVHRHDGSVELRSRPGEGTSVRLLIPAIDRSG